MKFLLVFLATCILFASNSFALNDGKNLYKKCRGCHGVDGRHVPFERQNGILAGRDKKEIALIIKSIKEGSYPDNKLNNIMKKTISSFSDEDIGTIAEYISKFKK